MKKPLHHYSAAELTNAFKQGEIKAVEIASYFLSRIQSKGQKLGAFLSLLEARTMQKAEKLDRQRSQGGPLGKLAAVPLAIKDNMHIEGELTTCGSKFLTNYKAPFSATAVRLLDEAGALFVGKTNLDEFAMGSSNENSAFFPAHNPWDITRSPGGSSGGSAAAVAARLSLLATGSDTGGSIRQPAGFTGIVGFKPTYGRVSRYGLVAFGSSLDQIGPLATCVEDAALAMEVMGQSCPFDATSLPFEAEPYPLSKELQPITLGVPNRFLENLKPEIRKNFDDAVSVFRSLGATIIDVDLDLLKYSMATYYILATAEASTNLARFDGIRYGVRAKEAKTLEEVYEASRKNGFGEEVKRRIMLGTYVLSSGFKNAYYKKAQQVRTLMIKAFEKAFDACDAILMPVAPSSAFPHGSIRDPVEMYLQDIFTIPANLAGLPAISIPSGFDAKGLPLGIQIYGPQLADVCVMKYAYAYEQATLHAKIPPIYQEEGAL